MNIDNIHIRHSSAQKQLSALKEVCRIVVEGEGTNQDERDKEYAGKPGNDEETVESRLARDLRHSREFSGTSEERNRIGR